MTVVSLAKVEPIEDSPDTEHAQLHEWTVLLELAGVTVHAWQGFATNSIEATDAARSHYFDRSIFSEQQLVGLRVRSVSQVGV